MTARAVQQREVPGEALQAGIGSPSCPRTADRRAGGGLPCALVRAGGARRRVDGELHGAHRARLARRHRPAATVHAAGGEYEGLIVGLRGSSARSVTAAWSADTDPLLTANSILDQVAFVHITHPTTVLRGQGGPLSRSPAAPRPRSERRARHGVHRPGRQLLALHPLPRALRHRRRRLPGHPARVERRRAGRRPGQPHGLQLRLAEAQRAHRLLRQLQQDRRQSGRRLQDARRARRHAADAQGRAAHDLQRRHLRHALRRRPRAVSQLRRARPHDHGAPLAAAGGRPIRGRCTPATPPCSTTWPTCAASSAPAAGPTSSSPTRSTSPTRPAPSGPPTTWPARCTRRAPAPAFAPSSCSPTTRAPPGSRRTPANTFLFNDVDIWCVRYYYFFGRVPVLRKLQARGAQVWWYPYYNSSVAKLPNFVIDKSLADERVWGWLMYQWKVDGMLYWGVNRWGNARDRQGHSRPLQRPAVVRVRRRPRRQRRGQPHLPGLLPALRARRSRALRRSRRCASKRCATAFRTSNTCASRPRHPASRRPRSRRSSRRSPGIRTPSSTATSSTSRSTRPPCRPSTPLAPGSPP